MSNSSNQRQSENLTALKRLSTDHNVYVLGAGFSVPAGMPTMAGFLNAMRDTPEWLAENNMRAEVNAINHVLDFRLQAKGAADRVQLDLDNIEDLFSLASATGDDQEIGLIQQAIAATLYRCERVSKQPEWSMYINDGPRLPKHWKADVNTKGQVNATFYNMPTYDVTAAVLAHRKDVFARNTFITFNYDLVLENALRNLGTPFSYGLKPEFADNMHSEQFGWASESDSQAKVLKLHGSINWGYQPKRDKRLRTYADYKKLTEEGDLPLVQPPTWRKQFADALNSVWTGATESLSSATRLIILGFSMPRTDAFFRFLTAAGLMQNISLREVLFLTKDAIPDDPRMSDLFSDTLIRGGRVRSGSVDMKYLAVGNGNLREALGRSFPWPVPSY